MSNETPSSRRPEPDEPEFEAGEVIRGDAVPDAAEFPAPSPTFPGEPEPLIEPQPLTTTALPVDSAPTTEFGRPDEAASADTAHAGSAEPMHAHVASEHVASEHVAPADPALAVTTPPPVAPSQPQIVYVAHPTPPRQRGNRGVGSLLAVLSAIVFAAVYGGIAALVIIADPALDVGADDIGSFLIAPAFWAPVLVFAVAYVLLVALVNRAGWWAHVLGGFIVALLTYGGFLLGLWLTSGAWTGPAADDPAGYFAPLWLHPLAVTAFVVAREVPIWMGALIGSRGRRLAARNAEARAEFEREQAAQRAQYGTPNPSQR